MYNTLKEYIQSQTQLALNAPGKTIADHVLALFSKDEDLASFDIIYQALKNSDPLPLAEQDILFNQHQDSITWVLMLLYQALGANVHATAFGTKTVQGGEDALKNAGIPFFQTAFPPDHPIHLNPAFFKRIFDCGAGTLKLKLKPAYGTLELTHTDEKLYEGMEGSFETLNNLLIKLLETYFGTGEAIVTTMRQLMYLKFKHNTVYREGEAKKAFEERFKNQYYLVIGGAGNVAAGTVRALRAAGIPASHIMLVDLAEKRNTGLVTLMDDTKNVAFLNASLDNKEALTQAVYDHIRKTENNEQNENNTGITKDNFWHYTVMGLVTGVPNLLTTQGYTPSDFSGATIYSGGHCNELGRSFPSYDPTVLADPSYPINFHPIRFDMLGYATDPCLVRPCSLAMGLWGLQTPTLTAEPQIRGLRDVSDIIDQKVYKHMLKNYPARPFNELEKFAYTRFGSQHVSTEWDTNNTDPLLPIRSSEDEHVTASPSLSMRSNDSSNTSLSSINKKRADMDALKLGPSLTTTAISSHKKYKPSVDHTLTFAHPRYSLRNQDPGKQQPYQANNIVSKPQVITK